MLLISLTDVIYSIWRMCKIVQTFCSAFTIYTEVARQYMSAIRLGHFVGGNDLRVRTCWVSKSPELSVLDVIIPEAGCIE